MSADQHTPGAWSVNDWPQASTDIAIGAIGTPLVAKIPLRDVSINEQKANAHLITAAPDMIDALRQWANAEATADEDELQNARASRDAAIAKALGQI